MRRPRARETCDCDPQPCAPAFLQNLQKYCANTGNRRAARAEDHPGGQPRGCGRTAAGPSSVPIGSNLGSATLPEFFGSGSDEFCSACQADVVLTER